MSTVKEVLFNIAVLLLLAACIGGYRDRQCHGGAHDGQAHQNSRSGSQTRR